MKNTQGVGEYATEKELSALTKKVVGLFLKVELLEKRMKNYGVRKRK